MYALITTTVNVPRNLEGYILDFLAHGYVDTLVIVAGDKKTPAETEDFCEMLGDEYQLPVTYLSPEDQALRYPKYSASLGWNTIQRRNIALLEAYRAGAEVIVTIDDDNLIEGTNYLGHHDLVGKTQVQDTIKARDGWYNICGRLLSDCCVSDFYPRGFSVDKRGSYYQQIACYQEKQKSVVNAGLWLGDPDVDAVTRLALNPKVTWANETPIALAPGTYCPFNSQNTALHRDVIPAYCMVSGVGRYDDIIPSFFVKRIADHLGHAITFGGPLVRQERNPHDLWRDLDAERTGMQLTDRIVDWLRDIPLTGTTYAECIDEVIDAFRARWRNDGSLDAPAQTGFINSILASYGFWKEALNENA